MPPETVLLIDVSPAVHAALASRLARTGRECLVQRADDPFVPLEGAELCVVGVRGRGEQAYRKVASLLKRARSCPLVVVADDCGSDLTVRWIRLGVADVIDVPADPGEVAARALGHAAHGSPGGEEGVVGRTALANELRERVEVLARTAATVLLVGERGSGKRLVARSIHARSSRRRGPFVQVHCADPDVERELFGLEREGEPLRRGQLELAADGTVFLDEVAALDLGLQEKVLQALRSRRYTRVGGRETLRLTARWIFASRLDLHVESAAGRFRADLHHRLNAVKVRVPPLRERRADVPLLVHAGLREVTARLGVLVPQVEDGFHRRLQQHDWPGNVSELFGLLERLLMGGATVLDADALDGLLDTTRTSVRSAPGDPAEIEAVLLRTGGHVGRAARRLGTSRARLRRWARAHGLEHLLRPS
jgi:DNA-binding NtrC family response regulator